MPIKIERNIPIPNDKSKELVRDLLTLKDGDSAYITYDEYSKTVISNCVSNARLQLYGIGLMMKSISDSNGRRVWVTKK